MGLSIEDAERLARPGGKPAAKTMEIAEGFGKTMAFVADATKLIREAIRKEAEIK